MGVGFLDKICFFIKFYKPGLFLKPADAKPQ